MTTLAKIMLLFLAIAIAGCARPAPVFRPVPLKATALALPKPLQDLPQQAVIAPPKTFWLTWDGHGETQWLVSTGPARGSVTNTSIVTTNRVLHQAGIHYDVRGMATDGTSSTATYWPSNQVQEVRAQVLAGINGPVISDEVWITEYTNNPSGDRLFLRAYQKFLRWQ